MEKPIHVSSPLGTRVNDDQICRDCELEISVIFLTVDLRVIDMSKFDVILGMDWLTTHRAVIDCDRKRVTAYTWDGSLQYMGRVVVPQSTNLREEILKEFHCSRFAMHPSGTKMYYDGSESMSQWILWPTCHGHREDMTRCG